MNSVVTVSGIKKIIRQAAAETNKNRTIMLSDLKDDHLDLLRPIPIYLEYDKEKVIANYYDTESFGYGDTEYEAINDLCRELVETYNDLLADASNLGPLPQKWWKHLQKIIGGGGNR